MHLLNHKKNGIYANISLFHSYSKVTIASRSSLYPDQMVDQHLEMTSTALGVNFGLLTWELIAQTLLEDSGTDVDITE